MTRDTSPQLALIIPCFNEEEMLPEAARRLRVKLEQLIAAKTVAPNSAIYFIDDGSSDGTWPLIAEFANTCPLIHGIKLAANKGHQNALLAGLLSAPGEVLVSMDADLQDDIDALDSMLSRYQEGFEIVYGVRSSRTLDSAFKRHSAEGYYRLLRFLGVNLVFNHADYRLMGRRAVEALRQYPEVNLFLRGIVPSLGFASTTVAYSRGERLAGTTKYPLRKMLSFAWNGITSFSNIPLRLITALGLATSALSLGMLAWVFFVRFFTDDAVPGWASITLPLFFLGGVQLLGIGVIGEYIAKIYLETKSRPRFIVEEEI